MSTSRSTLLSSQAASTSRMQAFYTELLEIWRILSIQWFSLILITSCKGLEKYVLITVIALKNTCLYGQRVEDSPCKLFGSVLSFFHAAPFFASVPLLTGECLPELSLMQVNKLWNNFCFILSTSNSTNKEERLWQSIPILHLEFNPCEDDSNGWSSSTFLSMLKLFEHTFMHTFIPLLGTVYTEQSKYHMPNAASLVFIPCHMFWLKSRWWFDPYLKH